MKANNINIIPTDAKKITKPKLIEHKCFGCSEINPHGLNLDFYYHDNKIYSTFIPSKYHAGWGHVLHGGLSATLCDESLGWLSMCINKSIAVTKELTFQYLKPISIDDTLTIVSSIEKDHERYFFGNCTIFNSKNQICVKAKGTMVKITEKLANKLNIMSNTDIKYFSSFINSIEIIA